VAATVSYPSPYCNSFVIQSSHGARRVMNKNRSFIELLDTVLEEDLFLPYPSKSELQIEGTLSA
jgi:hypothetical protein